MNEKHIMSLLTDELKVRFKELGSQQDSTDPNVVCRYYVRGNGKFYYITSYSEEDRLFRGFVLNAWGSEMRGEWVDVDLLQYETDEELPFGPIVELDPEFKEKRLSEIWGLEFLFKDDEE